jgi:hypothetical protein
MRRKLRPQKKNGRYFRSKAIMKRLALFAWCLLVPVQYSAAAGLVRVADGDCAALTAAVNNSGQEIVLARNGHYFCSLETSGTVVIDAAGSTITIGPADGGLALWTITGAVTIRNAQFVLSPVLTISLGERFVAPWLNRGDLILDSSSILVGGQPTDSAFSVNGVIDNSGHLSLQNVTLTSVTGIVMPVVYNYGGRTNVTNSTLAVRDYFSWSDADNILTVANSIITHTSTVPLCQSASTSSSVSLGGNVLSDTSCGFNSASDRVTNDAGFTDVGRHGGIVDTIALSYFSPARDIGVAANCAATDARGVARGTAHCDAGAYEFGGGEGQLGASGASGLYFDPAHNGHYVTVQHLDGGGALVIWNTFNEQGAPAWLYGVGTVSGNTIHVPQVSQNLGGKLQPGGAVLGSHETIWGSFDFTTSSCASATLAYNSQNSAFGSGSVSLTRLALVNGLECSP